MYKKNSSLSLIFFCVATANAQGYPAQQGYQVTPDADSLRREKLYILQKRGDELLILQNDLIASGSTTLPRICVGGAASGLGLTVIGVCKGDGYMITAGLIGFIGGGALAYGTSKREETKLEEISEQIKQNSDAIAKV